MIAPSAVPRTAVVLTTLALVVSACGQASDDGSDGVGAAVFGRIVVSAASSLTDAFGAVAGAFELAHPEADVVLNLAGSTTLREQILEGAPVDVFASANVANMDRLVAAGEIRAAPHIFAENALQIAVPHDNPARVTGLADLGDEALLIGLCEATVPCGDFGRRALAKAGVVAAVDTNELDVRSLLTKIEAGELDAGIVYRTDVIAARGAVGGVEIPESSNVVARYPIAVVANGPNALAAAAFVEFVLSGEGQATLVEFGFSLP